MDSLLSVLDRSKVRKEIVELYETDPNAIVVLSGPSGCGKSWFGKNLGSEWIARGGTCLIAEGDVTKQNRDFFPLTYSLSGLSRAWLRFFERDAKELFEILKRAAVIGNSFSKDELVCLTGQDQSQIRSALFVAREVGLIDASEQRYNFSHDIVRQFLISNNGLQNAQLLERYSECLKLLAPGEYALRSDLLEELGETKGAASLAISAALKVARGAARSARRAPQSLIDRIELGGLTEIYQSMRKAHEAFLSGSFANGITSLNMLPPLDSELLCGEVEYLRCLNLMELEDEASFTEALQRLESWDGYEQTEFELGIRLRLLRQQILILAGRALDARQVESSAARLLAPRMAFDHDAALKMHVVNRKADSIYEPEIALPKIQRALIFFSGQPLSIGPIYPIEYYKGLTNLCAVQIKLGEYQSALGAYETLSKFVIENSEISFPRKDIPVNNSIIAAVRSGLDITEAASAMEALSVSIEASGENFIHKCNAVALALLSGKSKPARRILDELETRILDHKTSESYLLYYFKTHNLSWQFHFGKEQTFVDCFEQYKMFVQTLNWPARPYILERCRLLADAIVKVRPGETIKWDEIFLDKIRLGPAWGYYGRGIPLCEIQFWSEV